MQDQETAVAHGRWCTNRRSWVPTPSHCHSSLFLEEETGSHLASATVFLGHLTQRVAWRSRRRVISVVIYCGGQRREVREGLGKEAVMTAVSTDSVGWRA